MKARAPGEELEGSCPRAGRQSGNPRNLLPQPGSATHSLTGRGTLSKRGNSDDNDNDNN